MCAHKYSITHGVEKYSMSTAVQRRLYCCITIVLHVLVCDRIYCMGGGSIGTYSEVSVVAMCLEILNAPSAIISVMHNVYGAKAVPCCAVCSALM